MDKRTKEYRESRRAPIEPPKIYFVQDRYANNYRVGRSDYPGDCFEIVPNGAFTAFQSVYTSLGFKLYDNTEGEYDEGFPS